MDKLKVIKSEALELLSKIIDKPDLEVTDENGSFMVIIKTEEDAPVVIGRHGETIKSIQKLLEVILYKKLGESVEILVNVNDYREKQQERIHEITDKYTAKTKQNRGNLYDILEDDGTTITNVPNIINTNTTNILIQISRFSISIFVSFA